MLIGYARTSTLEQEAGLEAQERDLKTAGCQRVFREQTSSVGPRKGLDEAMAFAREGDTFVVAKLDRLARSVTHMGRLLEGLEAKGVGLRILNLNLDTTTPTGKLMLNMLGAVAQFEREMMLERQREGIAKAKSERKYKGRKPTAQAKADDVRADHASGMSMGAIALKHGIGKGSVHRIVTAASPQK